MTVATRGATATNDEGEFSMRKPYETAEFRLLITEKADVLTVSVASSNHADIVEDGASFSELFPIL